MGGQVAGLVVAEARQRLVSPLSSRGNNPAARSSSCQSVSRTQVIARQQPAVHVYGRSHCLATRSRLLGRPGLGIAAPSLASLCSAARGGIHQQLIPPQVGQGSGLGRLSHSPSAGSRSPRSTSRPAPGGRGGARAGIRLGGGQGGWFACFVQVGQEFGRFGVHFNCLYPRNRPYRPYRPFLGRPLGNRPSRKACFSRGFLMLRDGRDHRDGCQGLLGVLC